MGADLVDGEGRRGSTGMLTAPLNLGRTHVWIAHLSCPLPSSSAFFACSPPLACSLSLTPDLPPLPHPWFAYPPLPLPIASSAPPDCCSPSPGSAAGGGGQDRPGAPGEGLPGGQHEAEPRAGRDQAPHRLGGHTAQLGGEVLSSVSGEGGGMEPNSHLDILYLLAGHLGV